ncbi:hypothetical protein BC835DRAFT_1329287 [Cytidiella melzeri]|nr:hypothetical protein BC835DRAFT_1329287 [Cytidiella melzeri]
MGTRYSPSVRYLLLTLVSQRAHSRLCRYSANSNRSERQVPKSETSVTVGVTIAATSLITDKTHGTCSQPWATLVTQFNTVLASLCVSLSSKSSGTN